MKKNKNPDGRLDKLENNYQVTRNEPPLKRDSKNPDAKTISQDDDTEILNIKGRKGLNPILSLSLVMVLISFESCSVIGGIFKTGMGVGIFIVLAILVIVGAVFMRGGKK